MSFIDGNLVVDKFQFTGRDENTLAVVEGPVTEAVVESRSIKQPMREGRDGQQEQNQQKFTCSHRQTLSRSQPEAHIVFDQTYNALIQQPENFWTHREFGAIKKTSFLPDRARGTNPFSAHIFPYFGPLRSAPGRRDRRAIAEERIRPTLLPTAPKVKVKSKISGNSAEGGLLCPARIQVIQMSRLFSAGCSFELKIFDSRPHNVVLHVL